MKFMKCNSKYILRMTIGMAGYGLGLVAMGFFAEKLPSKYCWALLPVSAIVYIVATIIRYVSELDEMWRKIITEAAAFSGIATGFTCFSYLFLHDMGAPEFHAEWAFYLMWAYYGIGLIFSWRRYK
jgi:hypothetical protein